MIVCCADARLCKPGLWLASAGARRSGYAEHGSRLDPPERLAVLEADGRRGDPLPVGHESRGRAAHPEPFPVPPGDLGHGT